ncbi:MAG TPA: hypothetical protein VFS40_03625 [Gemmatimonadales bacterium]|nr:hypothetical protein [Gemmatimonadales bacterium]
MSGHLPHVLLAGLLCPVALLAQGNRDTAGYNASSNAAFVRRATAGAPARISDHATIARMEKDGSVTVLRPGTNGFTCTLLPDIGNPPFCGDSAATQWGQDAFSGKDRPTNTKPGIAYMAQGGVHYETPDGQVVMHAGPDTKVVKEPPHWMVMWPVDTTSGLPTRPNPSGTYIMFAGTPFAHLMVYQDPNKMPTRK